MAQDSRRLLRFLRSRRGGDDLLRQLLKAQANTEGQSAGPVSVGTSSQDGRSLILRVRSLTKADPHEAN